MTTAREVAEALGSAKGPIETGGRFSKRRLGGRTEGAPLSTAGLNRLVQYEPKDLTISVEAGMRWSELTKLLADNGQMIPLDPPFAPEATVGGVVVSNLCGPRRRWFGSARDLVIGMQFATLEGKLVESGGMVVKNVAGLDMGKLMIGSLGTLAVVTKVNFKLTPMPPLSRTFLLRFGTMKEAMAKRDAILRGVLQPWSLDLLTPAAARAVGEEGWVLAVQAGGNEKMMDRYQRELGADGIAGEEFWERVREFTPVYLNGKPDGVVVRCSVVLSEVGAVVESLDVAVARAGNGVVYGYLESSASAAEWMENAVKKDWRVVAEFRGASPGELWPRPGDDFEVMRNLKQMFDPRGWLNPGRFYGRI